MPNIGGEKGGIKALYGELSAVVPTQCIRIEFYKINGVRGLIVWGKGVLVVDATGQKPIHCR